MKKNNMENIDEKINIEPTPIVPPMVQEALVGSNSDTDLEKKEEDGETINIIFDVSFDEKDPNIVKRGAPVWDRLKERFPEANPLNVIIAYGNKIYTPGIVPEYLIAHEIAHCERQGFSEEGAKEWWDKYLTDYEFVKTEEIIAYRKELQVFSSMYKDRNVQARFRHSIAVELCGPLYNKLMDYVDAIKALR